MPKSNKTKRHNGRKLMNSKFDEPRERICSWAWLERPVTLSRGGLAEGLAQSVTRRQAFKKVRAGLASAAAGLLVLRAGAQTYDMAADFSTTSNPNGVWSYRFRPGTSRDGNYALLPDFGPASGSFA